GLAGTAASSLEILLHVLRKEGTLRQSSRPLFGGRRCSDERLDQLAEIRERATSLQKAHETFEGFAKGRVRVVGGEIVAGCAALVPAALLNLTRLGQKTRFPPSIGRPCHLLTKTA